MYMYVYVMFACILHVHVHVPVHVHMYMHHSCVCVHAFNYPSLLLHAKLEFPLFIWGYRDTCLALHCLIRPTTTKVPW